MTTRNITDIDQPYALSADHIQRFREDGFIRLPKVFTEAQLDHYGKFVTDKTFELGANAASVPIEQRNTYAQAFIQVSNLWEYDDTIKAFSFSKRIARIAAELLGTTGVRMWHDQALYKEPGGGFTPWHVDQQYWPMASALSVTAWIPFHAVPIEMGPLCFGKGSHLKNVARDVAISDESEQLIRAAIKEHGLLEVQEPYALGDVSFHYGWTLHRAGPNTTEQPRKVHTVIYMDQDMRLAEPKRETQQNDWKRWTPSTKIGDVMKDPLNPVLYSSRD